MGAVVPLLREEVAPKRQTPRRRPNAELRTREHLTEAEVDKLIEAARSNRNGHRDATMILVAFRHGLRASELCDLRWDQVSFSGAALHVRRGARRAHRRRTHWAGSSCGRCAGSSGSRSRRRSSCSCRSAAIHSRRKASPVDPAQRLCRLFRAARWLLSLYGYAARIPGVFEKCLAACTMATAARG